MNYGYAKHGSYLIIAAFCRVLIMRSQAVFLSTKVALTLCTLFGADGDRCSVDVISCVCRIYL